MTKKDKHKWDCYSYVFNQFVQLQNEIRQLFILLFFDSIFLIYNNLSILIILQISITLI